MLKARSLGFRLTRLFGISGFLLLFSHPAYSRPAVGIASVFVYPFPALFWSRSRVAEWHWVTNTLHEMDYRC